MEIGVLCKKQIRTHLSVSFLYGADMVTCVQPLTRYSPIMSKLLHELDAYNSSWVKTTSCRSYSNISRILLLYKIGWYYNKFDSKIAVGIFYWCVKIPQCGYMEHGLKHITFYVQKRIAAVAMCYNPGLVHDKPLWSSAYVKLVYYMLLWSRLG